MLLLKEGITEARFHQWKPNQTDSKIKKAIFSLFYLPFWQHCTFLEEKKLEVTVIPGLFSTEYFCLLFSEWPLIRIWICWKKKKKVIYQIFFCRSAKVYLYCFGNSFKIKLILFVVGIKSSSWETLAHECFHVKSSFPGGS